MATTEKSVIVVGFHDSEHCLYALNWAVDHFFVPYASNPRFELIIVHAKPAPSSLVTVYGPGPDPADLLPIAEASLRTRAAIVLEKAKETCNSKSLSLGSVEEHLFHDCSPFYSMCGDQNISYPFTNTTKADCGLCIIQYSHWNFKPAIYPEDEDEAEWYEVKGIDYRNKTIVIHDQTFTRLIKNNRCGDLYNFSTTYFCPRLSWEQIGPDLTIHICKGDPNTHRPESYDGTWGFRDCQDYDLHFTTTTNVTATAPSTNLSDCTVLKFPVHAPLSSSSHQETDLLLHLLHRGFRLRWSLPPPCHLCEKNGTLCLKEQNQEDVTCVDPKYHQETKRNKAEDRRKKIGIGICSGVGGSLLTCLVIFLIYRCRHKGALFGFPKTRSLSPSLTPLSATIASNARYGVHVFTYEELGEATNNFNSSQELGDGGFGTVYHGTLRDGREVAVKRLYENNCKNVKQFMNEIEILARLCHQNLVTLYGCTSRHSRELLLVYEFIPNGTVADHLHGNRAESGPLPWRIRMSIAIETGQALSYLHASDIIHRDVKTNNILLDKNFSVKVADFGLSRLFPTDVTHVSTTPQGTPGYVDPEYRQCYRLTDKSDVYSFGVVLIELISSKPAVDFNRHRHEINLANLAIKKIQNRAVHELVDPRLEYEWDYAVRGMMTSVAALAFRCLQSERELRPSMEEVLEALKGIESEDYNYSAVNGAEVIDVTMDNAGATGPWKYTVPPVSPVTFTDKGVNNSC